MKKVKGLSFVERFSCGLNIENDELKVSIDDRPTQVISKNSLSIYLVDYYIRCEFLQEVLDVNPDEELRQFIKFINGKIDEFFIYHYSFFPLKMDKEEVKLDTFSLHYLDKDKFLLLQKTHPLFTEAILNKNVNEEYRSLLISKIKVKRTNENESRHNRFDRLDEIYTYHHIVRFLLDYKFGEIDHQYSSISTDNFPQANWSGTSHMNLTEIKNINEDALDWIKNIINFLEDKLYYRLIIRGEIDCRTIFDRAIFLRSILDPFFEKNKVQINSAMKKGVKRSSIQSTFILQLLKKNETKYSSIINNNELARFLQIRNSIIHPDPNDGIKELHFLYDKMPKIRRTIYDYIFTSIQVSKGKGLEDFSNEF